MEQRLSELWRVFNTPILETAWDQMDTFKRVYVGFNAVEAALWMALAIYVLVRCARQRRMAVEVVYAFGFLVFGLTDVFEMQQLTLGLLAVKLFVLISILLARSIVVRHYPGAKI
ncbi:MAG: hypothetical protein ACKV0T_29435 [Planctomycetales bacterium]